MKTKLLFLALLFAGFSHGQDVISEEEIIVEFVNENNDSEANAVGRVKEKVKTKAMERSGHKGFYVIKVENAEATVNRLRNSKSVKWASINYIVKTDAFPNDTKYVDGTLWGMKAIKADLAWPTNKGDQKVIVGVIDEGIMYWHEDLCGQIWQNPYDVKDGIDNDGNGYIDDEHGWDFMNNDNSIFDNTDNHGTHVSGTIGGKVDNGVGVIGVCPNVTIISAKFLEGYGYISDAIEALDYLTDLKTRHNLNIPVTSNSWGGGEYSQGMYDAIERSKNAGILFVAAAGNSALNNDVAPFYPANYTNDNVISVAAITSTEVLSGFSNYGATAVDIAAPGSSITSTVPTSTVSSGYSSYSGTSMATPHVSGAVALYKSANPTATYSQIKNAILSTARPLTSLTGKVATGGVLNVASFTASFTPPVQVRTCVTPIVDLTPPTKPTNLRAMLIQETSATIAWDAATDPESGIKNYSIYWMRGNDSTIVYGSTFLGTQHTIIPLPPGIRNPTWVLARNKWGLTTSSDTLYVLTLGSIDTIPPTAPRNLRAYNITPTTISTAWDTATDNRGVRGYQFFLGNPGGGSYYSVYSLNIDFTGLKTNTTYELKVRAFDDSYNLSAFTPSIFVTLGNSDTIPPSIPTNLRATNITTSSLTLNWNASTDNVGVSGYKAYWKIGANFLEFADVAGLSCNSDGLAANTTYEYYVRAYDAMGNFSGNSAIFSVNTLPIIRNPCDTFQVISATNVTAVDFGNAVDLTWNGQAESFDIYRAVVVKRQGKTQTKAPVKIESSSTYNYTDYPPSEASVRAQFGGDRKTQYSFKYYVKATGMCTTANEPFSPASNIIQAK